MKLSQPGQLGGSPSHSSQKSTPAQFPQLSVSSQLSRQQLQQAAPATNVSAAADFFEGISREMSSTSRGPIRGQYPGHVITLDQAEDNIHKHKLSAEATAVIN